MCALFFAVKATKYNIVVKIVFKIILYRYLLKIDYINIFLRAEKKMHINVQQCATCINN